MKAIETWKVNNGFYVLKLYLLEGELVTTRKLDNGNIHEESFTFKDLLKNTYPVTVVETSTLIFKKMTEQRKPKSLNAQASKRWDFWKAINLDKIQEIDFKIDEYNSWKVTKLGVVRISEGLKGQKYFSWYMLDDFFFYGVKFPNIKLEDRIKTKEIIFDALDNSKLRKKISIHEGFLLFDYNKIEPIKYEKQSDRQGDCFTLKKGKLTISGWSYPRDGGSSDCSIEDLWYNMKMKVQKIFHKHIPEIKANLENAIIDNLPHRDETY